MDGTREGGRKGEGESLKQSGGSKQEIVSTFPCREKRDRGLELFAVTRAEILPERSIKVGPGCDSSSFESTMSRG